MCELEIERSLKAQPITQAGKAKMGSGGVVVWVKKCPGAPPAASSGKKEAAKFCSGKVMCKNPYCFSSSSQVGDVHAVQ